MTPFEEWALRYQPPDEESARDAWNAAIEAAASLPARTTLTEKQMRALTRADADPEGWQEVVVDIWESHQNLIRNLIVDTPDVDADF